VKVDFVVRDRKESILRGLTAADLEVYEDGVRQDVESLAFVERGASGPLTVLPGGPATATPPAFVAVAFDRLSPAARSFAQQAALGYLDRALPARSWMGVFSIDRGLTTLQRFTDDRNALRRSLDRAAAGASASFAGVRERDAIRNAYAGLATGFGQGHVAAAELSGVPECRSAEDEVIRRMEILESRLMESFESLTAFLEHVSLVMELEQNEGNHDRLNLMTLHAAKGLEFETVFLPGWEEGLFPSQRTLDEKGMAGLEEERRLAYVGLTRAKSRVFVSFAANRRVHGQWQSALPSRFIGELPEAHVDNIASEGFYGNYGGSGFRDNQSGSGFGTNAAFDSTYSSPGWRRAQEARANMRGSSPIIEARAKTVATSESGSSAYAVGERVFHQKFGYGRIVAVEGNKLLVDFEKAGSKRVMDGFVGKA